MHVKDSVYTWHTVSAQEGLVGTGAAAEMLISRRAPAPCSGCRNTSVPGPKDNTRIMGVALALQALQDGRRMRAGSLKYCLGTHSSGARPFPRGPERRGEDKTLQDTASVKLGVAGSLS